MFEILRLDDAAAARRAALQYHVFSDTFTASLHILQ